MKIYIAGKITGFPGYRQHFAAAEARLAKLGFSVMNPAWHGEYPEFAYEDYFEVGKAMLLRCDAIFLLDNWMESPGAAKERAIAEKRGMRVFDGCTGEGGAWKELAAISMEEKAAREEREGKGLIEALRGWCMEALAKRQGPGQKKAGRDFLQGELAAYKRVADWLEERENDAG